MPQALLVRVIRAQMEAALQMLEDCTRACPAAHWDEKIAKYPFWMVAYHTLCFLDVYLSPSDTRWRPRTGKKGLHPKGRAELEEEYPSRRFSKPELLKYAAICRRKIATSLAAETARTLAGPSGFPRRNFSRAEMHLYNMRHVQHHAGQLSASLRRAGVDTGWVSSGSGKKWKAQSKPRVS